jgi:ABC-type polysaccharide/polyol phosphate export permease
MTLSPVALFAVAYQEILLRARLPDWTLVAPMVGWTAGTLGLGYLVFRRLSPGLAEEV